MTKPFIVLPRPGNNQTAGSLEPIPAPTEDAFVATFGNCLPRASYLPTKIGRVAYYELPPSSGSTATAASSTPMSRVLFIHGVQTSAIGLHPLARALSSRFLSAHCVLIDLWGHGLTDTPNVAHDASLFHFLLDALLAQLQWPNAHLIGYSFGASVTASFAAAKPERVSSMVLIAPAGLIRRAELNEVQRAYLQGGPGLEEQAQEWILEFLEGGKLVVPSDWKESLARGELVAEAVRDWQIKNHPGHLASVVGIVRDGGVMDNDAEFLTAAKTGIKTLCILGELDGICREQDLHDVGLLNTLVVSQTGHGVVREKVSEVCDLVGQFWDKI